MGKEKRKKKKEKEKTLPKHTINICRHKDLIFAS
jgi:hypothetical protein